MYTDAISLRNPCLFNAPRYPKYHSLFEGFQASTARPYDQITINIKNKYGALVE